jgi:DnaJ-domain-containing protein 1
MTLLYGIAAAAILGLFLHNFRHANTATLAKIIRVAGGILMLGAAALLGLRGRIDMALLLGSLGVWLLGWSGLRISSMGGRRSQTPRGPSRVSSAMLEMELDRDTGEMDGAVLDGAFAGRRLSSLDEASLYRLLSDCQAGDPQGARLLEAYLDRRFPQWRETVRGREHARPGAQSSSMSEEEAHQILGLQPGASLDEIRQAHRRLIKKLHPDQGGSTYLAARVNQAKEILLSRKC